LILSSPHFRAVVALAATVLFSPPSRAGAVPTSAGDALASPALVTPPPVGRRYSGTRTGSPNPIVAAGHAGLWVWHNVLSKLDGPKCPMTPTCSGYCSMSIARYGIAQGLVMTGARILKEGPDLLKFGNLRPVKIGDQWRFHDPPEANLLWP